MSIEAGSKLMGKITGITNFGAFVELPGGSTGLVHISEVADNYVKDIKELFKIGDEVLVRVMNVELDGKVGLSIRKAKDQPEGAKRVERPHSSRPQRRDQGGGRGQRTPQVRASVTFDDKVSRFLKDSEERISTLNRQTESKRGSRGARR